MTWTEQSVLCSFGHSRKQWVGVVFLGLYRPAQDTVLILLWPGATRLLTDGCGRAYSLLTLHAARSVQKLILLWTCQFINTTIKAFR